MYILLGNNFTSLYENIHFWHVLIIKEYTPSLFMSPTLDLKDGRTVSKLNTFASINCGTVFTLFVWKSLTYCSFSN